MSKNEYFNKNIILYKCVKTTNAKIRPWEMIPRGSAKPVPRNDVIVSMAIGSDMLGRGMPIWSSNGFIVRQELLSVVREIWDLDEIVDYREVLSPPIAKLSVYEKSGHYPYYQDSMFPPLNLQKEEPLMLRPMNCPSHIALYQNQPHSYQELPFAYSEIGAVFRYENPGALKQLHRCRWFHVEDGHCFVRENQVVSVIESVIQSIRKISDIFGLPELCARLSLNDEGSDKFVRHPEIWVKAEADLRLAAENVGLFLKEAKGEAAFYGPKIDFLVESSSGKQWQLGSVQVDRVLPERFNIECDGPDGKERVVLIHRAMIGSVERFIACLCEHYDGKWPFFLAPEQVRIMVISSDEQGQIGLARIISRRLKEVKIRGKVNISDQSISKQIISAHKENIPVVIIIGRREAANGGSEISLRYRNGKRDKMSLDDFLDFCVKCKNSRILEQ